MTDAKLVEAIVAASVGSHKALALRLGCKPSLISDVLHGRRRLPAWDRLAIERLLADPRTEIQQRPRRAGKPRIYDPANPPVLVDPYPKLRVRLPAEEKAAWRALAKRTGLGEGELFERELLPRLRERDQPFERAPGCPRLDLRVSAATLATIDAHLWATEGSATGEGRSRLGRAVIWRTIQT